MPCQHALVAVVPVDLPHEDRVGARPVHPAQIRVHRRAPVQRSDHRDIAVLLLRVTDILQPFGPETGAAEVVKIILGDEARIAQPRHPFGTLGRILRDTLETAPQRPVYIAVNTVEELVRTAKTAPGPNCRMHHAPLHALQVRNTRIAGHFNVAETMQRKARLPYLDTISSERIAVRLPRAMMYFPFAADPLPVILLRFGRVAQVTARVQRPVPI